MPLKGTNAAHRRRWYLRQTGRPSRVEGQSFEAVQQKVRSYHARGMSYRQMGDQLEIPPDSIRHTLDYKAARRKTYEALRRLQYEPPEPTSRVSATGTARRLGGLMRDGFPGSWLALELGMQAANLHRLYSPGDYIFHETAERVAALYDRLDGRKPEEFGVAGYIALRAVGYAVKRGSPPRACWDPDTIDDPEAIPEWTGACGTPMGLRIHYRDDIPTCQPCLETRHGVGRDPVARVDGGKLRRAREAAGFSLASLAEEIGVDKSSTYYWETGRSSPRSLGVLDELLVALKVREEDICE